MLFQNKVVIITGGASGIGGATTRAFLREGAKVAFTYSSSGEEAARIQKESESTGALARGFQVDVRDATAVSEFFESVERDIGPVDVLFANAGGLLKRSRCVDSSVELWNEALAVNLVSTFIACQAALRSMEPRRSGAIVTMSSLAGFDGGGTGASHYAASKAGIVGFTRALAKEVGPLGIRVNGVAPGLIGTRFHDTFNTPEGRATAVERTPLRREGSPEDVAEAVVYLASQKAAFVTGEILQINGGTGF